MALAPLAFTLYTRVMKHSPDNPDWFDRDRFVLSAGHASMLLYSTLHLAGYGITLDDLKNFRQLGSPTAGHPEYQYHDAPGIEATTGPLGQGLAMSVGMALAERMLAARFNRRHDLIDHHTYVIASDGDIQEGVGSEASSLAGHLGLGKLIVFFDNNHIQLAGPDRPRLQRGRGQALRGLRLARAGRGRGPLGRDARARHGGGEGRGGQALARDRALAHRLRLARTSRTPTRRTARRSARTR